MHGFRELLRIIVLDLVVLQIEQIAFAIVFKDCAEDPAMAVVISELSVFQFRI